MTRVGLVNSITQLTFIPSSEFHMLARGQVHYAPAAYICAQVHLGVARITPPPSPLPPARKQLALKVQTVLEITEVDTKFTVSGTLTNTTIRVSTAMAHKVIANGKIVVVQEANSWLWVGDGFDGLGLGDYGVGHDGAGGLVLLGLVLRGDRRRLGPAGGVAGCGVLLGSNRSW